MTKKILRQGLSVSAAQLVELANELADEEMKLNDRLKIDNLKIGHRKFQLNIINKKPNCSDTWEIE